MLSTHLNRIQGRIHHSEGAFSNLPEFAVSRVNPERVFHDGGGLRVWSTSATTWGLSLRLSDRNFVE